MTGNDDINFSAFRNNPPHGGFDRLIFMSIFIFIMSSIAALIFMVLWKQAGVSLGMDPKSAESSGSAIGGVIGLAGSAWAIARILLKTQRKRDSIFKKFASDNGFKFAIFGSNYDRIALLDYGPNYYVVSEAGVTGVAGGREFKLEVISYKFRSYRAFPHYLGVLRLQLPTPNLPSHELYKYPETPPDIKIPEGLGKISTEIIGNHIYFVKEDGLDMTPDGIRWYFSLIDSVASSPAQT